jgi:small subunit ribosomal protein S5
MSEETATTPKTATPAGNTSAPRGAAGSGDSQRPPFRKRNFRKPGGKRPERAKPEYDQKIISIRRVTRVMAGGRRFSFSVVMVIGDRKGRVGIGIGKATDTALAIGKAINSAKKNMVQFKLNEKSSIDHSVEAKYNSARIALRPNYGRGVVAGSSVRIIMELAGIRDITGRVISRSKNKLNNAQATLRALDEFIIARGVDAQRKPVAAKPMGRPTNPRPRTTVSPRPAVRTTKATS